MHLDELYRGIGLILTIAVIGAAAWIGAQVIPQVQAVASMPARIDAEAQRIAAQARLDTAQLEAKAKAAPTMAALEVEAQRTAIENDRAQAQALAQAELLKAQGIADRERATGAALQWLAVAFVVAALLFSGYFILREWVSARTVRTILELAAKEGGRLELPNGHTVTFLPAAQRTQALIPANAGAIPAAAIPAKQPEGAPVERTGA